MVQATEPMMGKPKRKPSPASQVVIRRAQPGRLLTATTALKTLTTNQRKAFTLRVRANDPLLARQPRKVGGTFATRGQAIVVVGRRGKSGLIENPATDLAYHIRWALSAKTTPNVCRVLDPQTGAVIATIDPITRVRTPYPPPLEESAPDA